VGAHFSSIGVFEYMFVIAGSREQCHQINSSEIFIIIVLDIANTAFIILYGTGMNESPDAILCLKKIIPRMNRICNSCIFHSATSVLHDCVCEELL
jgi:hypothetical protein